jgi:hypothetical protein
VLKYGLIFYKNQPKNRAICPAAGDTVTFFSKIGTISLHALAR